jgi:hypothetical protein
VICPASFGKKCPICEYFNKLNAEDAEWDDIKEIKNKDRNLYAVVPIDASGYKTDYEEKVYVYDTSYKMFTEMLEEAFDTQDVDYLALEDGYSVKAKFKEKKFGKNAYYECVDVELIERNYNYEEDIREQIPALDDLFIEYSYEQLKSMYFDMEEGGDDEETEVIKEEEEEVEKEEKPKRATRSTKTADKPKKEESTDGPKCPKGHKYGVDTDEDHCKSDCDDCDSWSDCLDAKDEANA